MNHLASNLRRLRKRAGLTQQRLADMAKMPRATLASMERDGANPGLDSVVTVAAALNVGLDELVSPPPEHRFFKVTPDQVKELRADGGRFVSRLLSPIASRGVQIQHLRLEAGCNSEGRGHPLGSQEFLFPYEGAVRMAIGGEEVTVEAGALLQFPGHVPHIYQNPSRQTLARAFSAVILA